MRLAASPFIAAALLLASLQAASAAESTAEKPSGQRVEIRPDQAAGAVRIIIDGEEAVIIDKEGLHVRRNIEYGGAITDYGEKGFIEQTLKRQPEKSNGR